MLLVEVVQILFVVLLVRPHLAGLRIEGTIVVGFAQQRLDRKQNGADVVEGGPLLLEDVEANGAREVHVRVKAGGNEFDDGRRVRVRIRKLEGQFVLLAVVDGLLWPRDCSDPFEEVLALGEG